MGSKPVRFSSTSHVRNPGRVLLGTSLVSLVPSLGDAIDVVGVEKRIFLKITATDGSPVNTEFNYANNVYSNHFSYCFACQLGFQIVNIFSTQ